MSEFLQVCAAWPAWPFTVALSVVITYWLLVILGALDFDVLDLDFDVDADADLEGGLADWGLIGVRWFNLGEVPLMLWVSVLALIGWTISVYYDRSMQQATNWEISTVVLRNFGLALLGTKLLTQPLRGKFRHEEPNTIETMIGRICTVVSSQVTSTYGNATCLVEDGAPLQLNVRVYDGAVPKSAQVEIIDFAPETGIYYVQPVHQSEAESQNATYV